MFGKGDGVVLKHAEEIPMDLSISYAEIAKKVSTPKSIYFDTVAAETIEQLRIDLSTLYDFGFVDYEMNKNLLLKY
jgi:hypothetical protein